MKLTEKELIGNYQKLMEYIEKYITGERKKKLLELYDKISDRYIVAPASSMTSHHGCYPGGLVSHTLNVVESALKLYNLWKEMGAKTDDYSIEELVFSALNHDLGKIGDMNEDYYLPNTSEWHVKNQGKVYIENTNLNYMIHNDRALWLLQLNGVKISENEYIAIRTHDGPILDENKGYYVSFQEFKKFKTNLPLIVHFADYMSYRIEFEQEREGRKTTKEKDTGIKPKQQKQISDSTRSADELFAKMFGTKED